MNKLKLVGLILGAVVIMVLVSVGVKFATEQLLYKKNTNTVISEARAVEIALEHANVTENEVTKVEKSLETENGVNRYNVELVINDEGYVYGIDAVSGEIVEYNISIDNLVATTYEKDENGFISESDAKKIALEHAGLKEADVNFVYVNLDYDDGIVEYEVEFWSGATEYDYEINASTGSIISYDYELEHLTQNTPTPDPTLFIGEAKAKEIVLQHAALNDSDLTKGRTIIQLDYDDNVAVYDIEFWNGNREYDYEVDAMTGAILSFDYDIEEVVPTPQPTTTVTPAPQPTTSVAPVPQPSASTGGGYITAEKAKSIAASHAGVSLSGVSNLKCEFDAADHDDVAEYEVEWENGMTEYEYTIDATTGAILEYDIDTDND